jgi:cytoskeletal protein RodZ
MGLLQATSSAVAVVAAIIARRFVSAPSKHGKNPGEFMTLLLLEALGALLIFVFIIWWTMFSGRKNGELKDEPEDEDTGDQPRK